MSIPNFISIARLLAVPLLIYLILQSYYGWAFWLFVLAGASDAADGYIAKHMGQTTELGAYLDPLADKALLVGVYVTLGYLDKIDDLVVILVVFRDLMIVGGVLLLSLFREHVDMKPALVSKLNTVAQIIFLTIVLADAGLGIEAVGLTTPMYYFVIATTLVSGGWYLVEWGRQMASVGNIE